MIFSHWVVDKIPIVTRIEADSGDFDFFGYNTEEEMLKDHPLADEDGNLSDEDKEAILNEEDPHENGYIGTDTVEVAIKVAGSVTMSYIKLGKRLWIHAGQ